MNDSREFLIDLFVRLRRNGVGLGLHDLLDLLKAVDAGYGGGTQAELQDLAQMLWCPGTANSRIFDDIWEESQTEASPPTVRKPEISTRRQPEVGMPEEPIEMPLDVPPPPSPTKPPSMRPLFFRAPNDAGSRVDASALEAYWPVSRRFMAYAWRHLRRSVPDGPCDVVDIEATIAQTVRQGFYLAPVYRRRESNRAHLILLVDRNGSMVPFHRFTRDLVETALHESPLKWVEVWYFQNDPRILHRDAHLMMPVAFEEALGQCSTDTNVLIASDAGAARGRRDLPRIRGTSAFLAELKVYTSAFAWLNPMPPNRWEGSSAEILSQMTPMFPLDADGLSNAIDVVRGQTSHRAG